MYAQRVKILGTCCARSEDCEVTSYAEGLLEDGLYHAKRKVGVIPLKHDGLWSLKNIHRLRVCIGGCHKTYIFHNDGDDDDYYGKNCIFTGTGDTTVSAGLAAKWGDVWVEFVVHGWPKEHYTSIVQNEHDDQIIFDGQNISLLKYLTDVVPQLYPEAAIEFTFISLNGYENEKVIKNFMTSQPQL